MTALCPTPFPDCQYKFLAGYIGPQICHWVANSSKIGPQFLCPQIFARYIGPKTFLPQFVTMVCPLPCGKAWLSSVVWSACVKSGNGEQRRIFEGWVKTPIHFKPFVDQSSCHLRRCKKPLPVANALPDCLYHVSFRIYGPLNLPLNCEKRRVFGGRVKVTVQFEAVSGPKFMSFETIFWTPLWMPTHLSDCLHHVPRQRYWPSKLPLSCEVVENRSAVFMPPIFFGVEDSQIFRANYYRSLPLSLIHISEPTRPY